MVVRWNYNASRLGKEHNGIVAVFRPPDTSMRLARPMSGTAVELEIAVLVLRSG
jgi:hypothetical protein